MNRISYALMALCFVISLIAVIGWTRRPSVDQRLVETEIQKRVDGINERNKRDRDYLLDVKVALQKDLAIKNKKINEYERQIAALKAKEIKPPVGAVEIRQRWKESGYETH